MMMDVMACLLIGIIGLVAIHLLLESSKQQRKDHFNTIVQRDRLVRHLMDHGYTLEQIEKIMFDETR